MPTADFAKWPKVSEVAATVAFLVWLSAGLVVYFGYARRNSVLQASGAKAWRSDATVTGTP